MNHSHRFPLGEDAPVLAAVARSLGDAELLRRFVALLNRSPALLQALGSYEEEGQAVKVEVGASADSLVYDALARRLSIRPDILRCPERLVRGLAHGIAGYHGGGHLFGRLV